MSAHSVQPLIYVPFFNRVSGAGGFMFRAWWDADRLDIDRVGLYPKAKYLSTRHARNHDVIEAAVLRSHMNPDIRF